MTTSRREARRFRHHTHEIGVARGWVGDVLSGWGLAEHTAAVELAVSELVTNAIVHGEGDVGVTLEVEADELCLVVSDQGHGDPIRRPSTTLDAGGGGWGLGLVDTLADRWGTADTSAGTSVWLIRRTDRRDAGSLYSRSRA
jgi:anti-sigma regulatory factor (Ser/Thr protein kinase)